MSRSYSRSPSSSDARWLTRLVHRTLHARESVVIPDVIPITFGRSGGDASNGGGEGTILAEAGRQSGCGAESLS